MLERLQSSGRYRSAVLITALAGMFALGSLRNANDGSSLVATSLAIGTLGMLLFVAIQRRIDYPLLPLELFRARNFEASLLTLAYGGIKTPNEFLRSRSIRPTPLLR